MNCTNCGGEILAGDEFCATCGKPVVAAAAAQQPPPGPAAPQFQGGPPPGDFPMGAPPMEPPPRRPGGFFSTPGGIVLMVCIALVVVAGIVVIAIVATRDGSSGKSDTTTTKSTTPRSTSPGTKTDGQSQVSQAQAVMDRLLPLYVARGYAAITSYMSADMKQRYETANPPWSQVSYKMTGAKVIEKKAMGPDTVVFTVEESVDDMGTPATLTMHYSMVKEGGTWKLDSIEDVVPTSDNNQSSNAAQDEAMCKQAMQAYVDSLSEYPFEPLKYQSFTWNDSNRTSASALVIAYSGDASSQNFTLSAVKGKDGTWIVTQK